VPFNPARVDVKSEQGELSDEAGVKECEVQDESQKGKDLKDFHCFEQYAPIV